MPNPRDWDQMLKTGLEMKALSQKFIDFAKMYGAGEGGEGEEDLEEIEDEDTEESEGGGQEEGMLNGPRNPKAALILALTKKKGKK